MDLELELEDQALVLVVVEEEVFLHPLLHSPLLEVENQGIHHLTNPHTKGDAKVANAD